MKPEIENLKAWMSGKSTTGYQRALAMREFEKLLAYVAELEQLRQSPVSGSLPLPVNISEPELLRLSKLKELYIKYTNEGCDNDEYELLRQLEMELNFCFAVKI